MRYAITMNDGSVAIMSVIDDADPEKEVSRWPEKERERVVSIAPIEDAAIPTDRTFRNAWKLNGSVIEHDMKTAAYIHMDRIRSARNARLAALDTDAVIALGKGDQKSVAEIDALKQSLRDIPQSYEKTISAAETVEDLKAIWPSELA